MTESREVTFWSRATLRIMDAPQLHKEIIKTLGEGSGNHKEGELRSSNPNEKWKNSLCYIDAPIEENKIIGHHLRWISNYATEHEDIIRSLISKGAQVDIYMSYSCDDDHRGFGLSPDLLEIFPRLGIRFEMSIMT